MRGEPGDLAQRLVVVAIEEQVLAVLAGRETSRHEQGQEAVLRELQLMNDLRPQQREGIAERRELEARLQLFGDRSATHHRPALKDERPQPALCQVGAIDQAIVAATHHDRIVSVHAHRSTMLILRSGL